MEEKSLTTTNGTSTAISMFTDTDLMERTQRACKMLVYSDLVPDIYKVSANNPEAKAIANAFIAFNKASILGIDPLTVMQNMYIVKGKPSWSSSFLISCVNSCGRFNSLKFKWGEEGEVVIGGNKVKNLTCVAWTTEKDDDTNTPLCSAKISLQMAVSEGWATNTKWKNMPEQMLMFRSASFWVRVHAPEISMGMYTGDENEDIRDDKPIIVDAACEDVTEGKTMMDILNQNLDKVENVQTEIVMEGGAE